MIVKQLTIESWWMWSIEPTQTPKRLLVTAHGPVTHWNWSLCGVWQDGISIFTSIFYFKGHTTRQCLLFRLELVLGQPWVVKKTNHCDYPLGRSTWLTTVSCAGSMKAWMSLVYRLQRGLSFLWFSAPCEVGLGATRVHYHCNIK